MLNEFLKSLTGALEKIASAKIGIAVAVTSFSLLTFSLIGFILIITLQILAADITAFQSGNHQEIAKQLLAVISDDSHNTIRITIFVLSGIFIFSATSMSLSVISAFHKPCKILNDEFGLQLQKGLDFCKSLKYKDEAEKYLVLVSVHIIIFLHRITIIFFDMLFGVFLILLVIFSIPLALILPVLILFAYFVIRSVNR